MEANEKLVKGRINIQFKNPFFAYLSLFLKFREDTKKELPKETLGCGVNIKGDFLYNKDFINKLTIEEIEGVIIHELLHLALLHLTRRGDRDRIKWNIAVDVCVNQIIKDNNFSIPKGAIISDKNNKVILFGGTPFQQEIRDCNKKTAEEIYNEIIIPEFPPNAKIGRIGMATSGEGKNKSEQGNVDNNKQDERQQKVGKGKGNGKEQKKQEQPEYQGFDYHFEAEDNGEISDEQKREIENEWKSRIEEALAVSKLRGVVPAGMERLIDNLHKEKINWKALLYRYIINQIPYDYTWAKKSKKSMAVGSYLPSTTKEKIDIVTIIDVSGSIEQEELTDFLSEIIGIARAFKDRVNFRLLTHETSVNDDYIIENGNINKIMKLQIRGGGGTSFQGVVEYIKDIKNKIEPKCVVWLTDGYGDKIPKQNYPIIWVLSKKGSDELIKGKGEIIRLKE